MAFKFISDTETTPSSADATALVDLDLDFGSIAPLSYKIVKFKIGNDNAVKTTFTLTAEGTNISNGTYVYENIYYSGDKIGGLEYNAQYSDILELDQTYELILEPNEISSTIWAVFACTPDYYGGSAQVILKVVES